MTIVTQLFLCYKTLITDISTTHLTRMEFYLCSSANLTRVARLIEHYLNPQWDVV